MKRHRPDAGFSLAALIFFAAAASIVAAAAVPAYQMQAKREREKELIFRGQEYTRAIQKYPRKFGTYPSSVDQLIQTNNIRFLRKAYKDPITGKDFRLIRINPDGSLSGSKVFVQNANNQPLFGNTQTFGQQQQQQPGPPTGQQPTGQQPTGQQPTGQQPGIQQPGFPQSGFQQGGAQQPGFQQAGVQQPSQQPLQPQQTQQSTSQPFGQTQQGGLGAFAPIGNGTFVTTPVSGAGVVGVASDSDETSLMVYNQRQKYSQWEFIAITGQTGPQGQPVQAPGAQTQANPFGGTTPSAPSASPAPFGSQPFGSQAGQAPFGAAPGPPQGQQPFSPGTPSVPGVPQSPFGPTTPGKLQ